MSIPTYGLVSDLPAAVVDELALAFSMMDPLAFCKYLHSLENVDIEIKRSLLAAKVNQKHPEEDQEKAMEQAIENAFQKLWKRISESCRGSL